MQVNVNVTAIKQYHFITVNTTLGLFRETYSITALHLPPLIRTMPPGIADNCYTINYTVDSRPEERTGVDGLKGSYVPLAWARLQWSDRGDVQPSTAELS